MKTKVISVRIDADMYAALVSAAERKHTTVNEIAKSYVNKCILQDISEYHTELEKMFRCELFAAIDDKVIKKELVYKYSELGLPKDIALRVWEDIHKK